MDKLLKLLNEYDKINEVNNKWFINDYWRLDREYNWATATSSCRKAISKDYGFIKRLIDNDKINRDKILKENWLFRKYFYDLEYVKNYDRLVMWLSVEDDPIEDLISYLK